MQPIDLSPMTESQTDPSWMWAWEIPPIFYSWFGFQCEGREIDRI